MSDSLSPRYGHSTVTQHPRKLWRVVLARSVEDWRRVLLETYTPKKHEDSRRRNILAETLFALEDLDRKVHAIETGAPWMVQKIEKEMKKMLGYTLASQIEQITAICYHADDKERLTHPLDLRARRSVDK